MSPRIRWAATPGDANCLLLPDASRSKRDSTYTFRRERSPKTNKEPKTVSGTERYSIFIWLPYGIFLQHLPTYGTANAYSTLNRPGDPLRFRTSRERDGERERERDELPPPGPLRWLPDGRVLFFPRPASPSLALSPPIKPRYHTVSTSLPPMPSPLFPPQSCM